MVNTLMRPFRRWPAVEGFLRRLLGRFTTGWDEEFDPPAPAPRPLAPAAFEMRFMRMHAEGRFDEMWEMIADDAQRAWGGREMFVRDAPRLGDDTELLDVEVLEVQELESWTDRRHERTYSNVAQIVLRYRVREQWKDLTLDRQVHLIPAAGGWRTLFYPAKTKSAAASR
jgi:hypothetical protein